MSYATLYKIRPDGQVEPLPLTLQNSYGGVMLVFSFLGDKYGYPFMDWDSIIRDSPKFTWWERNTLAWAFDWAVVKREDMQLMADSLRKFQEFVSPNKVSHLLTVADEYSRLLAEDDCIGSCLYATSFSDNLWSVNLGNDESRPYDINVDTEHHFAKLVSPTGEPNDRCTSG